MTHPTGRQDAEWTRPAPRRDPWYRRSTTVLFVTVSVIGASVVLLLAVVVGMSGGNGHQTFVFSGPSRTATTPGTSPPTSVIAVAAPTSTAVPTKGAAVSSLAAAAGVRLPTPPDSASSGNPGSDAVPTTAAHPTTSDTSSGGSVASTTTTTTTAASLCGAPPNPWGYNLCSRGSMIVVPAAGVCSYFPCVKGFDRGHGYMVRCADDEYALTGGRANCAAHGGVTAVVYSG